MSRFQEFANSSHVIGVSANTCEIRRIDVKKQVSETPMDNVRVSKISINFAAAGNRQNGGSSEKMKLNFAPLHVIRYLA